MKRNRVVLVLLALALLFVLGMLSANARVATSETHTNASVSTVSSRGNASTGGTARASLWLYVDGDDQLADAFRDGLRVRLSGGPTFTGVALLDKPPRESNFPILVAGLTERDVFWTPIYGRAEVTARFVFASDTGDVTWQDENPRDIIMGDDPVVRSRGDITIVDSTRGLITRTSYLEHLGMALAREMHARLQAELDRIESAES